jgi:predicted RNA-binding Zn-ribbon protein involved in translation (DUF1610 family)
MKAYRIVKVRCCACGQRVGGRTVDKGIVYFDCFNCGETSRIGRR